MKLCLCIHFAHALGIRAAQPTKRQTQSRALPQSPCHAPLPSSTATRMHARFKIGFHLYHSAPTHPRPLTNTYTQTHIHTHTPPTRTCRHPHPRPLVRAHLPASAPPKSNCSATTPLLLRRPSTRRRQQRVAPRKSRRIKRSSVKVCGKRGGLGRLEHCHAEHTSGFVQRCVT